MLGALPGALATAYAVVCLTIRLYGLVVGAQVIASHPGIVLLLAAADISPGIDIVVVELEYGRYISNKN